MMKNALLILITLLALGACFLAGRWSAETAVSTKMESSAPRIHAQPFTSTDEYLRTRNASNGTTHWKQISARLEKSDTEKLYFELLAGPSIDIELAALDLLKTHAKHNPARAWELAHMSANEQRRGRFISELIEEWASQDLDAAWEKMQKYNDEPDIYSRLLAYYLTQMAKTDPQRGIEIIRANPPDDEWGGVSLFEPTFRFFSAYADVDVDAAKKLAETLEEPQRFHAIGRVAQKLADTDPAAAWELIDQYHPGRWSEFYVCPDVITEKWMKKDQSAALAAIAKIGTKKDYQTPQNLDNFPRVMIAGAMQSPTRTAMKILHEKDPDAAFAYAMQLENAGIAGEAFSQLVSQTTNYPTVFEAIQKKFPNEHDALMRDLIGNWATADPTAAAAAVKALPPGQTQYFAARELVRTCINNANYKTYMENNPSKWTRRGPSLVSKTNVIERSELLEWARSLPPGAARTRSIEMLEKE